MSGDKTKTGSIIDAFEGGEQPPAGVGNQIHQIVENPDGEEVHHIVPDDTNTNENLDRTTGDLEEVIKEINERSPEKKSAGWTTPSLF